MDFQHKVVLVTGAGSGLGRGIITEFVKEGCVEVIAGDINGPSLNDTEKTLKGISSSVKVVKTIVDVTKAEAVQGMIKTAVKQFGRLDCVVNCAGVSGDLVATADMSEESYDRTMAINLKSIFLVSKAAIQVMIKQDARKLGSGQEARGSIVNISSVLGQVAMPNISPYVAAKHGVIGQTKADAADYAPQAIRVNAVCPGFVYSKLVSDEAWKALGPIAAGNPMKRLGFPEEVAAAVTFLSSDKASFITGQALCVDGGHVAV